MPPLTAWENQVVKIVVRYYSLTNPTLLWIKKDTSSKLINFNHWVINKTPHMKSFGCKNRRKTKAVSVLSALKIVYIKSEEPPKILKPAGLFIFCQIFWNISCETVPLNIPELLSLVYTVKVREEETTICLVCTVRMDL